MEEFKLRVNYK